MCISDFFCSSENELPTPTAIEEKVKTFFTEMHAQISLVVSFLFAHSLMHRCGSGIFFLAKATGVGASSEMAEDGEKMGQVQEQ